MFEIGITSNIKKYYKGYIDFIDHYWLDYFEKKNISYYQIPNKKKLSLKKIENDKDYVESLEVELDKRGHIAKNPNRSQGKAPKRKFLQAEKQIWGNLGLIYNASLAKEKRSTRYLFKDEGYKFNFKKINNLVKEFYANYGYESDITLKNSELIN